MVRACYGSPVQVQIAESGVANVAVPRQLKSLRPAVLDYCEPSYRRDVPARSFACPGATTGRGSGMTAHIRRECRLGSEDDLERRQHGRPEPGITASKPRNCGFQRCVTASISARITWEHSSSAPWRSPPETGARSSETLEATNAWTFDGQVLEVSDLRTYFVPPPSRARRRQLTSRRRAARGPRRSRGRRHSRSRCGRGSSSR